MFKRSLFVVAAFVPLVTHAECKDFLRDWMQQLHPGRDLEADVVACKIWPANPDLTLAALPLIPEDAHDVGADDLEIVVANTKTGEIIAHGFQRSTIARNNLRALQFDTARYRLTPDRQAFGVRLRYWITGPKIGISASTLSLYTVDGRRVRPVLERVVVEKYTENWDGELVSGKCTAGVIDDFKRSIAIGTAGRNGYATLKVSEKSVHTVYGRTDGCWHGPQSTPQTRIEANVTGRTIEYYDGKYVVPESLVDLPKVLQAE
ncbi:hypothetical protein [Burkholderia ubonensis]|uniref:hypothetical protein n=1 Tax=Burkholderia ubonensis TaxID=101571 RepID=UPI001160B849|nr:hypothetical protein [Burkholderia ubonensis]